MARLVEKKSLYYLPFSSVYRFLQAVSLACSPRVISSLALPHAKHKPHLLTPAAWRSSAGAAYMYCMYMMPGLGLHTCHVVYLLMYSYV